MESAGVLFGMGYGEKGHLASGNLEQFLAAACGGGTGCHHIVYEQEMLLVETLFVEKFRIQAKASLYIGPAGFPAFFCLALGSFLLY